MASSFRAAYQLRTGDLLEQGRIQVNSYRFPPQDAWLNRALDDHAVYSNDPSRSIRSRDPLSHTSYRQTGAEDIFSSMLSQGFERLQIEDRGNRSTQDSRREGISNAGRSGLRTRTIKYGNPGAGMRSETGSRALFSSRVFLPAYSESHGKSRYAHEAAPSDYTIVDDRARRVKGLPYRGATESSFRDDSSISPSESVSCVSSRRSRSRFESWNEHHCARTRRRSGLVHSVSTLRPSRQPQLLTREDADVEQYGEYLVRDITPRMPY